MKSWLKRIRATLVLGVTWAVVWAPVAVLLGLIVDPDDSLDEMWVLIGAYPGFLGGVVFSIVLSIAARRRGLEELSISRVAGWGALAGVMVGSLPFLLGDRGGRPVALLATVVISTITLLCAASAAGSLALARRAERRAVRGGRSAGLLDAGANDGPQATRGERTAVPRREG
jgi:membrane protease YdiL (CAAX protease family)